MTNTKRNAAEVRAEPPASKRHRLIQLGLDVHADSLVVVRLLDHAASQPALRLDRYAAGNTRALATPCACPRPNRNKTQRKPAARTTAP
jgi:hypothetical protein